MYAPVLLVVQSRLGCQVVASKDLDGIRLKIPAATRNFAVDGFVPKASLIIRAAQEARGKDSFWADVFVINSSVWTKPHKVAPGTLFHLTFHAFATEHSVHYISMIRAHQGLPRGTWIPEWPITEDWQQYVN